MLEIPHLLPFYEAELQLALKFNFLSVLVLSNLPFPLWDLVKDFQSKIKFHDLWIINATDCHYMYNRITDEGRQGKL